MPPAVPVRAGAVCSNVTEMTEVNNGGGGGITIFNITIISNQEKTN